MRNEVMAEGAAYGPATEGRLLLSPAAEKFLYLALLGIAAAMRFWDLGWRAYNHDESLHAIYSWYLATRGDYVHNPMMHGPFLFHANAFIYTLFGANDYTARVVPAIFGVVMVGLPYFLRRRLGQIGALTAAFLLTISPAFLFYSRFIRHDIYVAVGSMCLVIVIFAYLRSPTNRRLYLAAALTAFIFSVKEVAFIYVAIFGSFLLLLFLVRVGRADLWTDLRRRSNYGWSLVSVAVTFLALGLALLLVRLLGGEQVGTSPWLVVVITLGATAVAIASVVMIVSLWRGARSALALPSFDLIILLGTLCLPLVSPSLFVVLNPIWQRLYGADFVSLQLFADFQRVLTAVSQEPVVVARIALAFVLFLGVAALAGLLWSWRRWLIAFGIFCAIFITLHATFYTNGQGAVTGFIGGLGYWLAQQEVQRGGQPWFYYLILLPLYEFLPLVLGLAGIGYYILRARWRQSWQAESTWLFAGFLIYWWFISLALYSWAGEKMPWLVLHLDLPLILLGAWWTGQVVGGKERWRALFNVEGCRYLLALVAVVLVMGGYLQLRPLGGLTLEQLDQSMRWLGAIVVMIVLAWAIAGYVKRLDREAAVRGLLLVIFGFLVLATVRFAWMAAYKNGDSAAEMLNYAQASHDVPEVMAEIEHMSWKLVGDKDIKVAYDDESSWPFVWYFRDYPNAYHYGKKPSGPFDAPIVVVGPGNEGEVKHYLDGYTRRECRLIWWFPEDYKQLTPRRILDNLLDPEARASLWRFLAYREMSYAPNAWPLVHKFAVYTRRNLSSQVWQYGPVEVGVSSGYEERHIEREADLIWGNQGEGEGQFLRPRGIAVDGEGNVYVVDTGNNRVQKFDSEGEFMVSWGGLGSGPGEFQEPWGIGVGGDGTVYVADTWNHRVQAFDSEGRYLGEWGVFGQGEGDGIELYGPRDIEVDGRGDVYVTDTGNKRVQKVSGEGDVLGIWGQGGVGPGEFEEPIGIGIGERGEVYVADVWNRRVQKFGEGFVYEGEWKVEGWESQTVDNKAY